MGGVVSESLATETNRPMEEVKRFLLLELPSSRFHRVSLNNTLEPWVTFGAEAVTKTTNKGVIHHGTRLEWVYGEDIEYRSQV